MVRQNTEFKNFLNSVFFPLMSGTQFFFGAPKQASTLDCLPATFQDKGSGFSLKGT